MAIAVALQAIPDLPGRVCQPGDISLSDGNSITIPLNRNGDIRERPASIKTIQYNVRGLTGAEVAQLTTVAEDNLTNDIQGTSPTFQAIAFSGQNYPDCFLTKVTPSGSITVAGAQIVESTTLIYESKDRYLI